MDTKAINLHAEGECFADTRPQEKQDLHALSNRGIEESNSM